MPTVRKLFVLATVCVALAGCAQLGSDGGPERTAGGSAAEPALLVEVGRFSRRLSDGPLPPGWKPYIILPSKPRTEYTLVDTGHGVALEARAEASASGLYRDIRIDLRKHPWVEWRWRVDDAVAGADKRLASREDSPARLVVTFHGDPQSLDVGTRAKMRLIKAISGRELPYATLMYVWSHSHAPGTVLPNPHAARAHRRVVQAQAVLQLAVAAVGFAHALGQVCRNQAEAGGDLQQRQVAEVAGELRRGRAHAPAPGTGR
jgi:hypothetical protein